MDNMFDPDTRFKVEPQELIIDDEYFDGSEHGEILSNRQSYQYECSSNPTAPAFVPMPMPIIQEGVPAILDGQFFQLLTVNETTCTALCKLCEPRRKTVNGSLKATGNFYDHIKRMHISYLSEAERKRGAKRKPRTRKISLEPAQLPVVKNDSLPATLFLPQQPSCSQEEAFNAIYEFAIETMHPTSVVKAESFRALVEVLTGNTGIAVPTSQQIESCIQEKMRKMGSFLGEHLNQREFVCVSADLWRHGEAGEFVGVCGHTLDPATFERESFALGFRPVHPDQTDIDHEIDTIVSAYDIDNKVRTVVTHNVPHCPDLDSKLRGLRKQSRSFSHMLNLVVTVDVSGKAVLDKRLPHDDSGDKSKEFAKMYDLTMSKLTSFWNYLKTGSGLDFCAQFCGKILQIPTNEWSTKFEAVKMLIETESSHKFLHHVKHPRGKRYLEDDEITFLSEYVAVLQPFASAFDILKDAGAGSLAGTILPTILSIKCRLDAVNDLYHGETLKILALRGLRKRFPILDLGSCSNCSDLLIATISHPAFKMCLPSEFYSKAKEAFLGVCSNMAEKFGRLSAADNRKSDSFFSVLKSSTSPVDCVSNEGLRYLTDDSEDLTMLERYPWVKSIFLEYNTCLSSSHAVERLLNVAYPMLCASTGVGDKHFQDCLLLKINKHLY